MRNTRYCRSVGGVAGNVSQECACHGDFFHGVFAEGYAYCVADSVGAFHASFEGISSLGDSQVERVVHVFGVHGADELSDGGCHGGHVGCLDGENNIVEVGLAAYAEEFHGALYHSVRPVAEAAHHSVGERTVVHAYAYCGAVGAA